MRAKIEKNVENIANPLKKKQKTDVYDLRKKKDDSQIDISQNKNLQVVRSIDFKDNQSKSQNKINKTGNNKDLEQSI